MLVTTRNCDSPTEDYVMVEHGLTQTGASDNSRSSGIDLDLISHIVETASWDLRRISLTIHDNPELQFKEFHAHEVLTKYIDGLLGWEVTPSAYGLKTAFVAICDTGKPGPVVSFNAEYDALIGIGHACGHNLIAMVSLGAAMATAHHMMVHKLGGKLVLFGTPAEGKHLMVHVRLRHLEYHRASRLSSGMTNSFCRRRRWEDQATRGRGVF